jgi:DNA primase small subunit
MNYSYYRRIKYAKEEIILTFLYPRLDVNVSNEINHLLKTPFSVHPKTAKICVPFRRKDLNTFNPLNVIILIIFQKVPTLRSLEDEVNKLGGEIDFKKTSFNKYYEEFDEFITKCEKNT